MIAWILAVLAGVYFFTGGLDPLCLLAIAVAAFAYITTTPED